MKTNLSVRIVLFALAGLFPLAAAAAEPAVGAAGRMQAKEPDRIQLERRFESVGTLIEKSSGARQIEDSGVAAALSRRDEARAAYQEARAVYAASDLVKASELLSGASMMMFEAVRLAASEAVVAKKNQADFAAKLKSVTALLEAHNRIATEKGTGAAGKESTLQIEKLLAEADRQAAANDLDTARKTLEQAYLLTKASVSSMRTGDTLVRSLNFATKAEEYHYEIDRNDTHQMLVKVLLGDRPVGAQMSENVRAFLENAGTLRGKAEAAAARSDFEQGIALLEQSTAELVRAIRMSGVFIPG